jgi:hypothetical protein
VIVRGGATAAAASRSLLVKIFAGKKEEGK